MNTETGQKNVEEYDVTGYAQYAPCHVTIYHTVKTRMDWIEIKIRVVSCGQNGNNIYLNINITRDYSRTFFMITREVSYATNHCVLDSER